MHHDKCSIEILKIMDIFAIQDSTKEIAELYIDEINQTFDTDAKFHSVFVHTNDESNIALETSGVVSGRGVVSAVYTMPMEDTNSMYEKISAILVPKIIRDGGGFYNVAKDLSHEENSKMTFSLIPLDSKSLLQLKLSVDYPNIASTIYEISPLEFLKVENLKRSDYFSTGFYPLEFYNSSSSFIILKIQMFQISREILFQHKSSIMKRFLQILQKKDGFLILKKDKEFKENIFLVKKHQ